VPSASVEALRGCCLSPSDLVPFARMPLFVVVESDNAHAFASLPPTLSSSITAPLLCLLAPCPASPHHFAARKQALLAGGGALTLFLHEPITALCTLCGIMRLPITTCRAAEAELADTYCEITSALVAEHAPTPSSALAFLADPFLRTLMLRFALCEAAFLNHRGTRRMIAASELLPPRCVPRLPAEATRDGAARTGLKRLVETIGASSHFDFEPAAKSMVAPLKGAPKHEAPTKPPAAANKCDTAAPRAWGR